MIRERPDLSEWFWLRANGVLCWSSVRLMKMALFCLRKVSAPDEGLERLCLRHSAERDGYLAKRLQRDRAALMPDEPIDRTQDIQARLERIESMLAALADIVMWNNARARTQVEVGESVASLRGLIGAVKARR